MEEYSMSITICNLLNDISRKGKVSGKICFREVNLPQTQEEKEQVIAIMTHSLQTTTQENVFDALYQSLATYEDQLIRACQYNKRSKTALTLLQSELTSYYTFLEILLVMDHHQVEKQMETLGSFHQEANIHTFYHLKDRKELLEVTLNELQAPKNPSNQHFYDLQKDAICFENHLDKQEALSYYGFLTEEKREANQKKARAQKQKIRASLDKYPKVAV